MGRSRFQSKLKIKKGDNVIVIAGASKGTKGEVREVFPAKQKVIVDGVNVITKHEKPNAKNPDGGRVETEAPIHISNIALVDPKSGEATKVRIEKQDGVRKRIAKKSGQEI